MSIELDVNNVCKNPVVCMFFFLVFLGVILNTVKVHFAGNLRGSDPFHDLQQSYSLYKTDCRMTISSNVNYRH